eukprot:640624-Pelagomonas_calceolata.AAC.2
MTPFPCHTDGCGGYIRQAMLLEGPRGESFKQKQYDIPPELEEQLQAAKQKRREEQMARCSKRKPTEQVCACSTKAVFRYLVHACMSEILLA